MFPTLDGLEFPRKLLQSTNSQSYNLTTSIVGSSDCCKNCFEYLQDDLIDWYVTLTFLTRLLVYVTILTLLVVVVYMIMKYISDYEDLRSSTEDVFDYTESSPVLPPAKSIPVTYGTCDHWDIESGNCSITSSSEELYDGKICVICYTDPRNCFLVPCGHCATCYDCAQRIFEGENRTCPICRRLIRKVRKLCVES
ncbi:E3 ubiquitin-protein ligase APD2 isoform X1 [Rosa chinensis]|uniref:E3 ubiquitin-protein ligase APD2 isoform X1 n=1 Tax=Rosa chinensis TaxID=74649 RepID=UPI000D0878F2|nr:E3 ubiquitin-protein ligase APD2 isoform X1 [Rosa chinensis]